jgi:uncharacterized protein (TIGR02453 family)
MASGFPGFSEEAFKFFRGLVRNNNREWFLPRKPVFEEHVKGPMRDLVEQLNSAMKPFAPDYVTEPAKAIYRFYRDTRFSADKSPYKTQIAASFRHRSVTECGGAGFYFSVSHKELAVGGGVYMPSPETLRAIRGYMAEHHADFRRIVQVPGLRRLLGELHGEQLSRTPKGFPADHPAADLLRYKMYLLYVELPAGLATTPAIQKEIVKRFRAMTPFLNFLNTPLLGQKKKMNPAELLGP